MRGKSLAILYVRFELRVHVVRRRWGVAGGDGLSVLLWILKSVSFMGVWGEREISVRWKVEDAEVHWE